MERILGKAIHSSINNAFWMEKPGWESGSKIGNFTCKVIQALPFNIYETQKQLLLKDPTAIVNGESIVIPNGDTVNKYMFRYAPHQSTPQFEKAVTEEVSTLTHILAGVALSTCVSIKKADIFTIPIAPETVTQTQLRLDLNEYPALNPGNVSDLANDRTLRDLEKFLEQIETLKSTYGYYPDLSDGGDNLRISTKDGHIALLDVMPVYEDGSRLIGDNSTQILPGVKRTIDAYQDYIGTFGA